MGMTIDKAIEKLSASVLIMGPEDWGEARDILISTARKYQDIEQILKDIPYGDGAVVWRIQEVIENENDD